MVKEYLNSVYELITVLLIDASLTSYEHVYLSYQKPFKRKNLIFNHQVLFFPWRKQIWKWYPGKKWSQPVGTKSGWRAGVGRGWGRVWTSLSYKAGEYPCLLKFKIHAMWLKQPVGTKKDWQPPSEVASHLPVSTILRYRLPMCLFHGFSSADIKWLSLIY